MISICLTNFNREQLLYESIEQIIDDERISEIIISDDCSDHSLYKRVVEHYKPWPKVKVSRTDTNIDCYRNKHRAVSLATNEWVLLIDSDNVFSKEFIDNIFQLLPWFEDTILQPSFARPHFNFTRFKDVLFTSDNISVFMTAPQFSTMLNAANHFFNRDTWLSVWDKDVDPVTSDSIYQNYRWLAAGNSIYVVSGLEYSHRVNEHGKEEKSHYQKNHRRTKPGFHESIIKKLKELK